MTNKRIIRAISAVLLLALLISLIPLTGMVGMATAETTEAVAQKATSQETREPNEAEAADTLEDLIPEVQKDSPDPYAGEEAGSPSLEEGPILAPPPAADEAQADSVKMTVPFVLWGSNELNISFSYPGDTTNTVYTTTLTGMKCHYINGSIAYCLEPQASSEKGTYYTQLGDYDDLNVWEQFLSDDQQKAIALVLTYGATNTLTSTNDLTRHGYELATQVIIWEIIVGHRNTTRPYSRTNAALYNFYLPQMINNDNTGVLRAAFLEAYNSINTAIAEHGDIPSFASQFQTDAPTHYMTYNASAGVYTITLTDENNAIVDDFPFQNGNGLTFSKSGNTMTITATAQALQNAPVMVTSTGSDPDVDNIAPVVWATPNSNHEEGQILCQAATPDPVTVYFKLAPGSGSMTIQKTSEDLDDVSGYCFKLRRTYPGGSTPKRNHWGKSDDTGAVYAVDTDNYIEPASPADRVYTFDDLIDGTYIFMEALSQKGKDLVWPESIQITVTNHGSTIFDHTYTGSEIRRTDNGDASIQGIELTGLSGGGELTIRVQNEPVTLPLTIYKAWTDDNPNGCSVTFRVEQWVPEASYWWQRAVVTLNEGESIIPSVQFPVGSKLRITEINIPEGYHCTGTNPQIIEYLDAEHCSVSFENAPDTHPVSGKLTIVKVDRGTRDTLEGAGFRLYDADGVMVAEDYTDPSGQIVFEDLSAGYYEYQEFEAPVGYELDDTRYPFNITEETPEIEVERENDISQGSIRVRKVNEKGQPMADVYFLLEYSLNDGMSWLPIKVRDDTDPVLIGYTTNDDAQDGVAPTSAPDGWVEFNGLAISNQLCHIMYRLTEVKTWDGYELLTEPVFVDYLNTEQVSVELTAVNYPVFTTPMTGGDGYTGAALALGLCVLGAAVLLWKLPRKREGNN